MQQKYALRRSNLWPGLRTRFRLKSQKRSDKLNAVHQRDPSGTFSRLLSRLIRRNAMGFWVWDANGCTNAMEDSECIIYSCTLKTKIRLFIASEMFFDGCAFVSFIFFCFLKKCFISLYCGVSSCLFVICLSIKPSGIYQQLSLWDFVSDIIMWSQLGSFKKRAFFSSSTCIFLVQIQLIYFQMTFVRGVDVLFG